MFYEIGLFRIDRDDYIMSSSGQYGTAESGTKSQYQNIGGMRSQGLELALNGQATEKITYNAAYTYMDAEFTQYDNYNLLLGNPYRTFTIEHYDLTGNDIPRVPKHHLNLAMKYQMTNSFSISPEMDAISTYYADELNRHKIPGHAVFNLLVDYETKLSGYDVALFARVDNLLDKTYYNSARGYRDSDKDGDYDREDLSLTVNEGRTVNVGLQIRF
jgi:iron complex outermembrane receptor protein